MKENTVPFHRHIISLICVAIISGGVVQMLNKPQLIDQTENDELAKVHTLFQNIQDFLYHDFKQLPCPHPAPPRPLP